MINAFSKLLILLLFLAAVSSTSQAQKEGAIWYFGHNAGLDFTRHYPKPITDGQVYTREGVASISTAEGDLLFYTDGTTVWNQNHQVMDNGFGLFGSVTSTQSSMIVPTPGLQYEYYIFTVDIVEDDGVPGHGLNYSIVDMVQNNRLGRVGAKNQLLLETCVEKITAVKHHNGEDYWIIAHGWNDNRFYVYELTRTGVRPATGGVFTQDVGAIHQNTDPGDDFNRGAVGYMKSSPKGDFIAVAIESSEEFELFSFNNKSGEIKLLANMPAGDQGRPHDNMYAAYGVEFSPTSNYLYGSTRRGGKLYRWDLTQPDQNSIRNSLEVINPDMKNFTCGAIQLAFNGKIYVCFAGKEYLGVINSPTQTDPKFVQLGASLIDNVNGKGGKAYYGLPTFLPDFFKAAEFYFENTCQNDTTLFYLSTTFFLGSDPTWTITTIGGDFVGRATVDKETKEGTFVFNEPGDFIVELKVNQNGSDIVQRREITIHSLPELNFSDTTILCQGKTVVLDAGDGAFYKWSDNVNLLERFRTIGIKGDYSVQVTHNNGCMKFDTTLVVEKPLPVVTDVITSKASCGYENGSITLITQNTISDYTFEWKDFPDSTGNTLRNLPRGVYEVDVVSNETGCVLNKKVTISETGAPDINIIPSLTGTICPGTEITITAEGATNYEWSYPAGSTESSITLNPYSTETYVVEGYSTDASGAKCSGFQQITVEVYPFDPPQLGQDLELCDGEEKILDGLEKYNSHSWSNGETGRFVTITEDTRDLVLIVEDNNSCLFSDTVSITFKPLPTINLGEDRTICLGAPLPLDAGVADEYLWNTGDTARYIDVSATGHYSVLVTSDGCSAADDVIVKINNPDSLRVDSVLTRDITCFGADNGQILVFVKGEGSLYEFSLDDGVSWEQNNGIFEQINAGTHHVIVREDSACMTDWPGVIEVVEPEDLEVNYKLVSPSCTNCDDGRIILNLSGGTPPYDILWSNFDTGKSRSGLSLGEYSVSITDNKFCTTLTTINLDMGHGAISIPNAFTPNSDGVNDTWLVKSLEEYPDVLVTIYDRQGKVVFQSPAGYPEPWDGTFNNEYLPMGTYYYVLKLNDLLDLVTGSITLLR